MGPVTSLSPSCAAEPESRIEPFGEGCLSAASSRAILIRDGGGGTPESLLLSRVVGAACGRTWFWALLPKHKCLVARGAKPRIQLRAPLKTVLFRDGGVSHVLKSSCIRPYTPVFRARLPCPHQNAWFLEVPLICSLNHRTRTS